MVAEVPPKQFLTLHNRTTDYHCHILPGLDDGPATVEEALEMAGALAYAGFYTVCCTPHLIKGVYDNTADKVRSATGLLQEALDRAKIPVKLVPGFEYYLDEFLLDALAEPLLLPGNLLLVEIPPRSDRNFVTDMLHQVLRRGITPLIAHPERCELLSTEVGTGKKGWSVLALFTSKPQPGEAEAPLLGSLRTMGCKFQANLGSFAGLYGERVRRQAQAFQASGLYSHYGSDLHTIRHKGILTFRLMS